MSPSGKSTSGKPPESSGAEPAGYAEAVAELEALVAELDSQSVDVDVLSRKVGRASYLVEWCKARIDAAEMAISQLGVEAPGRQ